MKDISNESLEEDTDPEMVDRELAGEADGYYTLFLSDEQVLARQSWVGCFGQRISVNKGVEAGTE